MFHKFLHPTHYSFFFYFKSGHWIRLVPEFLSRPEIGDGTLLKQSSSLCPHPQRTHSSFDRDLLLTISVPSSYLSSTSSLLKSESVLLFLLSLLPFSPPSLGCTLTIPVKLIRRDPQGCTPSNPKVLLQLDLITFPWHLFLLITVSKTHSSPWLLRGSRGVHSSYLLSLFLRVP